MKYDVTGGARKNPLLDTSTAIFANYKGSVRLIRKAFQLNWPNNIKYMSKYSRTEYRITMQCIRWLQDAVTFSTTVA